VGIRLNIQSELKSYGHGPEGIGIDSGTGEIYVIDENNNRIQKFAPWNNLKAISLICSHTRNMVTICE